jgi:hypothetical protein
MQTLKAIETSYRGCRMRSRLEARYAVAFDAMGLDWQYEVEGYDLGGRTLYLPDFWLPELEVFVEIKATPCDAEAGKMQRLADASGKCVWVLFSYDTPVLTRSAVAALRAYRFSPHAPVDLRAWPGFLVGNAAAAAKVQSIDLLTKGLRAARSARFEHGEQGTPA